MSAEPDLSESYRFSCIVQWYGRVNFTNMKLISKGAFDAVSSVPALVQNLEAIRSSLPDSLQNTDFREISYLTFKEETYSSDTDTGSTYRNIVIPEIFITNGTDGLTALSEGQQPTIYIKPITRADYNLVTATLRDLDVSFEISHT